MSPRRDFDKDVSEAAPWEKRIAEKIEEFMLKYNVRKIPYGTQREKEIQKSGIDVIVKSESSDWEIKTRDHKYYEKGILLETKSIVERNILGWLYTSQADVIAYCWLNESSTNLMPNGYFIMLKNLRQTLWFKTLTQRYHIRTAKSMRKTPEGERFWTTEFITPPIEDFPRGTLYRFNAILPSNYKQTILPVEREEDESDG